MPEPIEPIVEPTPPEGGGDPAVEGLGDAGKQAIDRMKAERTQANQARQAAEAEVARLKAAGASAAEQAKAEGRAEGKSEALTTANERIIRAEVKAAAAGKLRVPSYAERLLDLSQFKVADDGTVDEKAISAAIDDLVKQDPDLAATPKPGSLPGGGARPAGGNSMDDEIRRLAGRR